MQDNYRKEPQKLQGALTKTRQSAILLKAFFALFQTNPESAAMDYLPKNRLGWAARLATALFAFLAQSAPAQQPATTESIELGPLERVKIDVLAQMMSDASGRPFAVAGGLDTEFSVLVPENDPVEMSPSDIYEFGLAILASAGLTVIDDGPACRIVNLNDGGVPVGNPEEGDGPNATRGLVTRVFRLRHASADDVRRVLEGGSGRKSWITMLESANLIVATDTAPTLERVAKLVEELDKPGLARKTEIVKLTYADADALAAQLNAIAAHSLQSEGAAVAQRLAGAAPSPRAVLAAGVAIPAPAANALVLVGQEAQVEEFKALVKSLDVDAPTGRGNLNVIPLQYLKAEDVAKTLSTLLEKSAAKAQGGADIRRIAVEASAVNNAIVVDASPGDFRLVKQLVDEMDVLPGQVQVSVMIAELTDGDGFNWNVGLTALDAPGRKGETRLSAGSRLAADSSSLIDGAVEGILPQGIVAAFAHGSGYDANGNLRVSYPGIVAIEALKSDSHVNIVSETSLQAQNNIEAEVKIVDDIPYAKSNIQGTGADRETVQTIDRMEVGVTLKFTPYIVPGQLVRMALEPTIASVMSGSDDLNPTIAKRSAKTTVTVPDSETIVIAGLTRTTVQKIENRIPILGSIPLLGWLFRYKSDVEKKTNLLIFVTPTVIASPADAAKTTDVWKLKTGISGEHPKIRADEAAANGTGENE